MEKIREYNRKLPNLTDAPDSRVAGFHTGQRGVSRAVPTFGPGFLTLGQPQKKFAAQRTEDTRERVS